MSNLNQVKSFLEAGCASAMQKGDVSELEQLTRVWHSAAEADKFELDVENNRRLSRSESVRFWIPIIAPLVSAAALAITLIVQMYQIRKNIQLQTQAEEGTEF